MNRLTKEKKIIWSICCFIGLFFLYCLRSPLDFGTSYLWCEDGMILYKEANEYGFLSVFHVSNGSLWVIQRFFGWICYSIVNIFNIIRIYPFLLSIITKAFEVGCVFYFTSEKFSWIIESKWMRLFVVASVLVAVPDTGIDVVNCDTSSGFICIFAVFLMGLNALRKDEYTDLSVFEILFLVLMALSSLGAPFVFGVALLHFISFIVHQRLSTEKAVSKAKVRKRLIINIIMLALVLLATCMQLLKLMESDRTSQVSLDLFERIKSTFLYFVWFPYSNYYYVSIVITLIGILLWVVISYFTKANPLVVIYGAGFSSAWLFICSLSCDYHKMFMPLFDINNRSMNTRLWTLSYMIAAFYVGCAVYKLWQKNKVVKVIAVIILIIEIGMLAFHYRVASNGREETYIRAYDNNMAMCDTRGSEELFIPIGPFEQGEPFGMYIPVDSISSDTTIDSDIHINNREEFSSRPLHIGLIIEDSGESPVKEAYLRYDDLDYYVGCYRMGTLDSVNGNTIMRLEFMSTAKLEHKEAYELYVLLEDGRIVRVN